MGWGGVEGGVGKTGCGLVLVLRLVWWDGLVIALSCLKYLEVGSSPFLFIYASGSASLHSSIPGGNEGS